MIRDLQLLRGDLARHFEEEEAGGCLDEAVARQPNLGRAADRFQREHAKLLGQLDRLVDMLQGRPSKRQSHAARDEFRDFAEQLHAHETAENQILKQGFGCDLE